MRAAGRAYSAHAEAELRGVPVAEVVGERRERTASPAAQRNLTRRELLAGASTLATGAAMAASPAMSLARSLARSRPPRIAIVGGGLAGLRCAHMLWNAKAKQAIACTVYEANPQRTGGRCWTLRDYFASGLLTEHGGEFLNTGQRAILRLVRYLGLELEVVNGGELRQGEEAYLIDGGIYTYDEANSDWHQFGYRAFHGALREAATPAGLMSLDAMSVPEWLHRAGIGTSSRFGKLMLANTVAENGGDPEDQSALDLIELVGHSRRHLSQTGGNERFHVAGGNDQIVSGMLAQLPPGALHNGYELIALRAGPGPATTLVFDVASSTVEVKADVVVLALPFSTLRLVDLADSGLSASKLKVIDTLGMGTNAKIHVQLAHKTWPALGYSGSLYSEWEGFCSAWDDSVALGPDASPALFLGFPGGTVGATELTGQAHGPAPEADVAWFLSQVERIYPGTMAAYTRRAYEDHWALDPWVRGSYSYARVGQAATYVRLAGQTEGAIHFAGEHTSIENQGFLDGGVETGERAAREILRGLGQHSN